MASYQIPQFLDSGEKILGPMNLRQFGYALGGFMVCAAIFTVLNALIPGIGYYALFFVVPIAILAAYLALGRYNGRDSEIYVYKLALFILKQKNMVYQRQPYMDDLDKKQAEWTFDSISKRWARGFSRDQDTQKDKQNEYGEQNTNKTKRFRDLGQSLDSSTNNALSEVKKRELEVDSKEAMLKEVLKMKKKQKEQQKKKRSFF